MINITENAKQKIKEILFEEKKSNLKFRIFVQGGGCSGFSYGFITDSTTNEDDYVLKNAYNDVIIDSMSLQYLTGSTVDYIEDLFGSRFKIDNPNVETICGCGSSFNVSDDFYDDFYDDL